MSRPIERLRNIIPSAMAKYFSHIFIGLIYTFALIIIAFLHHLKNPSQDISAMMIIFPYCVLFASMYSSLPFSGFLTIAGLFCQFPLYGMSLDGAFGGKDFISRLLGLLLAHAIVVVFVYLVVISNMKEVFAEVIK